MFKIIVYKEITDNIRNMRFTVGSLLIVIMSFISIVILTSQYNDEVKGYHQRVAEQNTAISEYAHINRLGVMTNPQIPPSKFHPVVLGVEMDAHIKNFNSNPLNTLFPPFDFIIIISILMSLLAILFSYNSISGEAEDGTLRLMLSNPLPRMLLLTAKWVGGIICISIPFILSILIISIYVTISPIIQWSGYHWLCFGLLCIASLLFISIFYLIGLVVSCLTKNSTLSMLISLFTWVLFILVIPNLSPYVAAQFHKVPSVNKIEKETNRLTGVERDNLLNEKMAELLRDYNNKYGEIIDVYAIPKMKQEELAELLQQNAEAKKIYLLFIKEYDNVINVVNNEQRDKARKLEEDLNVKSKAQTALAKNIAAISPYACFTYIATDITATGLHNMEYLEKLAYAQSGIFWEYADRKYKEMLEKDPMFGYNSYIDLSDRPPIFVFREEPVSSKWAATRPYWFILLAFNGLLLILAYVCFRRYDVR